MIRKPQPKEAAKSIRSFLETLGVTLSQRNALELVARVEGYNSWQAMTAVPLSETQNSEQQPYDKIWAEVAPSLVARMQQFADGLEPLVNTDYRVIGPNAEVDGDEFSIAVWLLANDESAPRSIPLLAKFTLCDNEQPSEARYTLFLTLEDPYEGTVPVSWMTSVTFGQLHYSASADDLLERLKSLDMASILAGLSRYAPSHEYLAQPSKT